MPIKIPKGFQRRKSSGNALDDVPNPPAEGTFKVIDRTSGVGVSFDGGYALTSQFGRRPVPPPKANSACADGPYKRGGQDTINRGSGGTDTSLSTAGPLGSAASSMRLSTSSTTGSSVENYSDASHSASKQRPLSDVPPPSAPPRLAPYSVFKKRTGSSEMLRTVTPPSSSPHLPRAATTQDLSGRNQLRTVSASTADTTSTATPPRLFDSDLVLENSELDDFSNMFDKIGVRNSREIKQKPAVPVHSTELWETHRRTDLQVTSSTNGPHQPVQQTPLPTPLNFSHRQDIDSSPYSCTSQDSSDRLMRSPSPTKTVTAGSPFAFTMKQDYNDPTSRPQHNSVHHAVTSYDRPQPLRYSPVKRIAQAHVSPVLVQRQTEDMPEVRPYEETMLQSQQGAEDDDASLLSKTLSFEVDPALAESVDLATQWENKEPPVIRPPRQGKVMTPAQFERYRADRERERRLKKGINDSDSDDDKENYQDDDDLERDRQATKQRRKQEAHLAVYRQSMMKVTGEQPGTRPFNQPNGQDSHRSVDPPGSGVLDEEEDEDVPLGILAAHGFPTKNKPPSRPSLTPSPSHLGIAPTSQPQPSVVGDGATGRVLPPFARNLPRDPYLGASLVNASNRESLAMGSGSVIGAPTINQSPNLYPVHPAGLVGVIAGEERQRAMRRGSPSAQGTYEHPGMVRSQTMGNLPQLNMMPGMFMPGDPGQTAQLSAQMNHMMQVQMQWMQQMQMQMSQLQGVQQGSLPMSTMSPDLLSPRSIGQRPQSMPLEGMQRVSTSPNMVNNWNRSSSFVGMGPGPGYAASIAPSERSNIGLASRYRPVSNTPEAQLDVTKRSSTFTTGLMKPPWSSQPAVNGRRSPTGATIRTVNPSVGRKPVAMHDDDDDEEGWAEMKAKRDKKKTLWEKKRTVDGLKDLFPSGL